MKRKKKRGASGAVSVEQKPQSAVAGAAAPAEPPSRDWRELATAAFVSAVILAIGFINAFLPGRFPFFAFYTSEGEPIAAQIMWTLACLLGVVLIYRARRAWNLHWSLMLLVAMLAIASFVIFRVRYQSFFPDGDHGGCPSGMQMPRVFGVFKSDAWRLVNWLNIELACRIPDWIQFHTYSPVLYRNFDLDNACVFLSIAFGAVLVVVLTVALLVTPAGGGVRLGMQLFLLCASPMLNAYGFFNSYVTLTIGTAFLCMIAWQMAGKPFVWHTYIWPLLCLPLWLTLHPFAWSFPAYLVVLVGMQLVARWGWRIHSLLLIPIGLAFALLPMASYASDPQKFVDAYTKHGHTALFAWTQFSSLPLVALPAFILLGVLWFRDKQVFHRPSPLQQFCIVILVASTGTVFVPALTGSPIMIVHKYGIYGGMIYGAVALLFLSSRVSGKLAAYAALIGVFTFLPTIHVHSGRLIMERMYRLMPYDYACQEHINYSPYLYLALATPIDRPEDRDARLDVLYAGVTNNVPEWEKFRQLNSVYHIAWSFELDKDEQGVEALKRVYKDPAVLQDLWVKGTRMTDRYEGRAYRKIRNVSRAMLERDLQAGGTTSAYAVEMLKTLDSFEKTMP